MQTFYCFRKSFPFKIWHSLSCVRKPTRLILYNLQTLCSLRLRPNSTCVILCYIDKWFATRQNKVACAPCEDLDQPGYSPSLIRVFVVGIQVARPSVTLWAHSTDSDQTGRTLTLKAKKMLLQENILSCIPDKDIHVFYLDRQFLSHPCYLTRGWIKITCI